VGQVLAIAAGALGVVAAVVTILSYAGVGPWHPFGAGSSDLGGRLPTPPGQSAPATPPSTAAAPSTPAEPTPSDIDAGTCASDPQSDANGLNCPSAIIWNPQVLKPGWHVDSPAGATLTLQDGTLVTADPAGNPVWDAQFDSGCTEPVVTFERFNITAASSDALSCWDAGLTERAPDQYDYPHLSVQVEDTGHLCVIWSLDPPTRLPANVEDDPASVPHDFSARCYYGKGVLDDFTDVPQSTA
jgi:hypothetical protein